MKVKGLFLILISFIFVMPVFFTSCEENGEETVYMTEKTVFMLEFDHYRHEIEGDQEIGGDKDWYMSVKFLTDNLSQIPELTVNDTTFTNFGFTETFLTLYERVPYAETIEYSVSLGDTSTSGTINMPVITEATCNGENLLVDDDYIFILEADSFKLKWEDIPDYAIINPYSYQDWKERIIDTNHTAIDT
ncbi:hypothetical protein AKJ55_01385, partial [candidate division MSBL1 archaeon SCGC-AAA382M17]